MADGAAPFSPEDIDLLLDNIDHLSEEELAELNELVSELESRQNIAQIRDDLIAFCCHMQSDYKVGNHHRRLANLLEDIEARRKDRICVSVPPRHGKSQMVSIYYAAWYLGKNPTHKIMLVSHTTDLAVDFGRKVRNLINTDEYKEIFPNLELAKDSKSAGRWNTSLGGEFFAAGVGSALAGRGAHLLLIDDPHSEQDVLSGNFGVFEKAYEWFAYGARTRLMPGGAVAVVHCMTGDTGVLRPDGTETPLKDIRPGDMIASYDNGVLVSKKVLNWANQGLDHIYTLRMNNGNLIRANARHPFLVVRDGVETWVKVRDLGAGDQLVSLKGATSSCPANGQSKFSSGQFSTSEIIEITPSGVEDVFDIQVEDTENFIANGVVSHNTRWNEGDLIGRLISDMANNEGSDQYEVFEFPAILDTPEGEKALWPEFFDLKALYRTKASMPAFQWNAQYQQKPTAEEAAIIKREWWRLWGADDPPDCEYIIMSLDAAAETHNRADFTSLTTWGVFLNEEEDAHQLILLNAIKERVEFPELKRMCMEQYNQWEPDSFIVEKKSAGVAIYQELRRIGIPVQEYTPHRGTGDKTARLNSVADIISSGMVWVPTRRWAEELVEEVAGFPFMKNDDQVDSSVMALMRFRQGGFISLPDDWEDDPLPYRGRYEYY
jgi:predicted phage terminase large subunit-like protein